MELILILKVLVSIAIGALIGTERERKHGTAEFAGIRTFILIALFGTTSAYLSTYYSYFLIIAFLSLAALVCISYFISSKMTGDIGTTTEIAALLTFLLGAFCYNDEGYKIAPIIAIIVTVILAIKPYIHRFIRKISEKEMLNTLKFLIIAFVILPLLPNQFMGPFDVFNPYQIWLMIVFISAISYAGYILLKLIGDERGLGLTGIIGGLVSSTAVVTAMAGRVRENSFLINGAVFATVIASSMMFFRVLFEVLIINPELVPLLLFPMLAMGTLGGLLAAIILKNTTVKHVNADVKLKNPFSLKPAFIFGALFLVILFITRVADLYFGSMGIYVASLLSGVADVDAITISMALQAKSTIPSTTAVIAITMATISNTVFKFLIALLIGTRRFAKYIGIIFILIILTGIITITII